MIEYNVAQGSRDWHIMRAGMMTGSTLCRAVGSPKVQETFMAELISEKMTEPDTDGFVSKAMEHGNNMEPFAVKALSRAVDINFESFGMLLSEEIDGYGMSPEAVARDAEKIIIGGAETKCPNSKKHIEYLLADVVPKEYWHQCLSPFLTSDDIEWWYFVSYDPRNYEKPLFFKLIQREAVQNELDQMRVKLIDFMAMVDKEYYGLTF